MKISSNSKHEQVANNTKDEGDNFEDHFNNVQLNNFVSGETQENEALIDGVDLESSV